MASEPSVAQIVEAQATQAGPLERRAANPQGADALRRASRSGARRDRRGRRLAFIELVRRETGVRNRSPAALVEHVLPTPLR